MFKEEDPHILEKRFYCVRRLPKHPSVDDRNKESFYIQVGLAVTLFFFSLGAFLYPEFLDDDTPYIPLDYVMIAHDIPETDPGQKKKPPPPRKPAVPVESDVVDLLEEIEFDMIETLDFVDLPEMPVMQETGSSVSMSPKPYFYKWPEYPESEQKKGHQGKIHVKIKVDEKGFVIDHEVILNTTKSKVLEKLAVAAAKQSRFIPAKDKRNRPITVWTVTKYTFGTKN